MSLSSGPSIRDTLSRIREGVLDVLYPPVCPMCGERVVESNAVTQSFTPYRICNVCYRALPRTEHAFLRGNAVEQCFQTRRHFERGGAYLRYEKESPIRQLVHHMKFGYWPTIGPELAYYLGVNAALEWQPYDWFDGITMIVPIPLHPRREKERGYNQSEYIARGISDITGLPVRTDILRRVRETHQQARQKAEDRAKNVQGAFELSDLGAIRHQHVLLVDDLVTTGATVNAAIDALSASHTCRYSVFAIGKAM